jgi:hypothetical protein
MRDFGDAFMGQAVYAFKVASVDNRYPQVVKIAVVFVD